MRDLTGQKFNKWTVLLRTGTYKNKCALWKCRCDCGFERELRTFHLTNGYSKQCRQCGNKSSGEKHKIKYPTNEANGQFWKRYVLEGAKKRNIKVVITLEEANNIFKKQKGLCALTGLHLAFPKFRKDTNGNASLDRIDSSKDYTIDNVQWVDKDINIMKNNHNEKDFIMLCQLVTKFAS